MTIQTKDKDNIDKLNVNFNNPFGLDGLNNDMGDVALVINKNNCYQKHNIKKDQVIILNSLSLTEASSFFNNHKQKHQHVIIVDMYISDAMLGLLLANTIYTYVHKLRETDDNQESQMGEGYLSTSELPTNNLFLLSTLPNFQNINDTNEYLSTARKRSSLLLSNVNYNSEILNGNVVLEEDRVDGVIARLKNIPVSSSVISVHFKASKFSVSLNSEENVKNLVDTIRNKFPNCRNLSLRGYITDDQKKYLQSFQYVINAPVISDINDKDLFAALKATRKDPFVSDFAFSIICRMGMMSDNNPNKQALSKALLKLLGQFNNISSNSDEVGKIRNALEYISKFPIGAWPPLFKFGSASVALHYSGLHKLVNTIQDGTDQVLVERFITEIMNSVMTNSIGKTYPFCLIGQPGTGKTRNAVLLGYMVAYFHYFIYFVPASEYDNITQYDVDQAIDFALKNYNLFYHQSNMVNMNGKNFIDGSPRVYVSADAGVILKHLCGSYVDPSTGNVYPIYTKVFFIDEVDKAAKTGVSGEAPVIYSIMFTDNKLGDLFCEIQYMPFFINIVACNKIVKEFAPVFNRYKQYNMRGFSNIDKLNLVKLLVAEEFKYINGVDVVENKDGDIVVQLNGVNAIIIKNIVKYKLVQSCFMDIGLRNLKKYIGDMLASSHVKYVELCRKNAGSCLVINENNMEQFLPKIDVKYRGLSVGQCVAAIFTKEEREGVVVKSAYVDNNAINGGGPIVLSPGGVRPNGSGFSRSGQSGDVAQANISALLELLKRGKFGKGEANNQSFLDISRQIESKIIQAGLKKVVIEVVYNEEDEHAGSVAALSGLVSYIGLLFGIVTPQIIIGYCDVQGNFCSIENPAETYNICLNAVMDVQKYYNQKFTVIVPRCSDSDDEIMHKLGVPKEIMHVTRIKQVDNIFDIVKIILEEGSVISAKSK